MKILLDENKNYYKANMHCHSTNSDGKRTPGRIKEDYKKEGYSVVAFTDHELLIDNSYLNDDGFLAITACEIAIKENEKMSTLVKRDMKVCHLNLYAIDPHNTDTPCYNRVYDHFDHDCPEEMLNIPKKDYKRKYGKKGINKIIKEANKQGFLVSYNHPKWSLEDARDYLSYKGLWALEVFNTASWREGFFDFNMPTYDEFLKEGQRIACVAGDDNHKKEDSFGGYVMINAETLEYGEIMEALKNHNFYTSTGAKINGLYIDKDKAHLSVPSGRKIIMTTGIRRRVVRDLSKEINLNDLVFEIAKEDKYIRFDVIDQDGKTAHTQAYFI